jgi:hypothetical protein
MGDIKEKDSQLVAGAIGVSAFKFKPKNGRFVFDPLVCFRHLAINLKHKAKHALVQPH